MKSRIRYGGIILLIFIMLTSGLFIAGSSPGAVGLGPPLAAVSYASGSQADLVIESVVWSPLNPSKGDTVTISVTIKNQGTATSFTSTVSLFIDGNYRDEEFLYNIEAGDSVIKEFTWIAQQNSHIFTVIVDREDTVDESNETNNVRTVTITPITPDLVVQSVSWTPTGPTAGDNVTFTFIIRNQGNGKAPSSFGYLYIDNERISTINFGEIESDGIYTSVLEWTVKTGEYDIRFVIDPNDRIIESDENNNEYTVDFTPILPDLYIKNIEWSPSFPTVGESVNLTITIGNQGRSDVGECRFHVYVGKVASLVGTASLMAVGEWDSVILKWKALPGDYHIRVEVDPLNSHKELLEDNNDVTLGNVLSVISPDLTIDSMSWLPEEASPGDTITFSVTVRNLGYGEAVSSQLYYYIDGEWIDSRPIPKLSYGYIRTETFDWTVEEGSHTFRFVVDAFNQVSESNEKNNENTILYPVPPDLLVTDVAITPTEPAESDNATFTFSIENKGGVTAENVTVACYIDDDYMGYVTGGNIASKSTENFTYMWNAVFGDHECKAIVDPFDRFFEDDEENNEKIFAFSVSEKLTSQDDESETPGPGGDAVSVDPGIAPPEMTEEEVKANIWFFSFLGGGLIILLSYLFYEYKRRHPR